MANLNPPPSPPSPPAVGWSALKIALAQYVLVFLLFNGIQISPSDSASYDIVLARSGEFAIIAHLLVSAGIVLRRPRHLSIWDLRFIRFGLVPLCLLAFELSKWMLIEMGTPRTRF